MIGVLLGLQVWAQALEVSISPSRVYVGDLMMVTVSVSGVELQSVQANFSKPTQAAGQMISTRIVNGHRSMQLGVRMVPLETGVYRLESLTAQTTSGEVLTYDGHPTITVEELVANPNFTLETKLDPADPFPGDAVKVFLTLRAPSVKAGNQRLTPFIEESFFGGLQERQPQITFDASTTEDTPLRQTGRPQLLPRKVVGDLLEWTWVIPYQAVRSGEQHFPAPRLNDLVVSGVANGQLQQERVMAMGQPLVARVLAPPQEGRPKGFTGAIGSTFKASLTLSAHNVNVGDPLELRLTLLSDGDDSLLRAPTLPPLEGFRMYGEPTRKTLSEGTQFTYNVRPVQPGLLEIPPLELGWFDRAEQCYKTVLTEALPLRAKPSAQLMLLDDEGGLLQEHLPPAMRLDDTPTARTEPSPWAWGALGFGVGCLLLRLFVRPLWRLLKGIARRLVRRSPTAIAHAQLKRAQTPSEAANTLRQWAGRPALTATELETLLAPSDAATRAVKAYGELEAILYTGMGDFQQAVTILRETLPQLRLKSTGKRASETVRCIIFILFTLCAPSLVAADAFVLEQAKAETLNATQAEAYAKAANVWLRLAREGEMSQTVLMNGVTCALFAHRPHVANTLLQRYEALYGCDASSNRAAAAIAEALQVPLPWTRTVFEHHYTLSFGERLDLFCLWAGLFLFCCALPWKRLRWVCGILLIGGLVLATSLLHSWWVLRTELPAELPALEVQA